jgi:DNA-binding MarR family transcriptional regulator
MKDDASCACTLLRQATRTVTAAYDKALEPSGLRITQFSVLRTLDRHGPMPVTQLAAKIALERSTMGRNLDPLKRQGFVMFEVGETDQRERIVHLTEAGQAAIRAAMPHWRNTQKRIATLIGHASVRVLADQVARLHDE